MTLEQGNRLYNEEREHPLDDPPSVVAAHPFDRQVIVDVSRRVDDTSDEMNPLECVFRKLLPIPTTYYWEMEHHRSIAAVQIWHGVVATLGRLVNGMDAMGQSMAHALGITSSQYSYVMAYMTEEDWRRSREAARQRMSSQQQQLHQGQQQKEEDAGAMV
jgi:hypothetical protein